jgi:predicted amidohydrolase YtcJ
MNKLLLSALFLILAAPLFAQTEDPADSIFINGNVYVGTAVDASPDSAKDVPTRRVEALAVKKDRIIAAGSNEEIGKLKGPQTKIVDLGGRFVMPGFNDAHLHLAGGGLLKINVDLTGTASLADMQSRIASRAKGLAKGEWLLGGGWDHTLWASKKLPTRQDLDRVVPDNPAVFDRIDGHIAIANTAALKQLGWMKKVPDPTGGKIDRNTKGEPTGILRETAVELMSTKIPPPLPARRRQAIELALAEAAEWGITSAQDGSTWEDFLVYEELEREGKLTTRITLWLPFDDSLDTLQKHRAHHRGDDLMLRTGMIKGYMDGSLGSRTATLLAPYADDPGNSGIPRYPQAQLNAMTAERAAAGFQFGFHAIGDRGVEQALEAFSEAMRQERQKAGERTEEAKFRYRIEHAQVTTPAEIKRMGEMGVIGSMQPNHLLTDMNWAEERIGKERAKSSYAWRQMLDNGVRLAFGTDYPVEPITPFRGLYAAVTRKNEAGTAEYVPAQAITIGEAIAAYTEGAAYAEFSEKEKGTLAPGMLADFVVLDRDITKSSPAEILQTRVLRTVVGGKTVFERKAN